MTPYICPERPGSVPGHYLGKKANLEVFMVVRHQQQLLVAALSPPASALMVGPSAGLLSSTQPWTGLACPLPPRDICAKTMSHGLSGTGRFQLEEHLKVTW